MGLCLGMQLLATTSTELGFHSGLGWVPGAVNRIQSGDLEVRVPRIGWNDVQFTKKTGLYSDMTIFSFHSVKAITTGEGGVVLTNNKALYDKLLMLRNHGITKDGASFKDRTQGVSGGWYYEMQCLGFNYRITDLQCALGVSQLRKLHKFLKRRVEIAAIYNEKFSGTKEMLILPERPYAKSSRHIYYIRLKDSSRRKYVFDKLRKSGIGAQVHYMPVYLHPFYKELPGAVDQQCAVAEKYYSQTITLPLYQSMTTAQVAYVVKTVKRLLK